MKERCHHCGKQGHLKRACRARSSTGVSKPREEGRQNQGKVKTNYGEHHISREAEQSDVEEVEMFTMYSMSEDILKVSPIQITLKVWARCEV